MYVLTNHRIRPTDYCLWWSDRVARLDLRDYINVQVCVTESISLVDLKQCIIFACSIVIPFLLQRVQYSVLSGIQLCITTCEEYFVQHLHLIPEFDEFIFNCKRFSDMAVNWFLFLYLISNFHSSVYVRLLKVS